MEGEIDTHFVKTEFSVSFNPCMVTGAVGEVTDERLERLQAWFCGIGSPCRLLPRESESTGLRLFRSLISPPHPILGISSPKSPKNQSIRSLMKLTHGEVGVEMVDMEQEIAYVEERDRGNLIDYLRELEDRSRIKMMKAKRLSLQVEPLNEEYRSPRIQHSAHLGAIGELESVVMMINHRLLSAISTHRLYSRQKGLTISGDKNQKMPMELEDEHSNFSDAYSNSEQKNLMLIQRLESPENLASSCFAPTGQEVEEAPETNHTIESNETAKDIGKQSDDGSKKIVQVLKVKLMEDCSNCEQRKPEFSSEKSEESYTGELVVSAETEKKAEQIVDGHANLDNTEKNLDLEESDTQVPENSDEPMNSSSDVSSSMTRSSSAGKSKHQSPHRRQLFSKLKKMLLGKHSHNKEKIYRNKTPISCASSDTRESVSACSSDDARSSSSHTMLSWFVEEDALAKGLSKTKSSVDRWNSNSAWCQSFFRYPIGIPQAKSCDLQD
ncbi:hypothetical protein GW17_00027454 [Ensete ventricosum]|nr:hypothetical protein GW17_00027454 [Ensete ventricosum]